MWQILAGCRPDELPFLRVTCNRHAAHLSEAPVPALWHCLSTGPSWPRFAALSKCCCCNLSSALSASYCCIVLYSACQGHQTQPVQLSPYCI